MDCVLLSNWDLLPVGPPLWGLSLAEEEEEEEEEGEDLMVTSFRSLNTLCREHSTHSHTHTHTHTHTLTHTHTHSHTQSPS